MYVGDEVDECAEVSRLTLRRAHESGLVTNLSFEEVVVSTYSGKIVSFSSEPIPRFRCPR